jgi:hypothetical protein
MKTEVSDVTFVHQNNLYLPSAKAIRRTMALRKIPKIYAEVDAGASVS